MASVEDMLAKCGDFHRYQFTLMALFSLLNVLSSMHYYSQTIISFVPNHWCLTNATTNVSLATIKSVATKYEDPYCTTFNETWETQEIGRKPNSLMRKIDNVVYPTTIDRQPCEKWIYELDYGYESMTSELNWICQHAWKSTMGQSMFFVGSVIGTLSFGILADRIGRLPVLIFANMTAFIGNLLTIFALNLPLYSICRFISGLSTDSNFVMMYILVMEYMRPTMRTLGLNLCIGIFYCVGSMVSPWIAVWMGSWRYYLAAVTLPLLIVPLYYFVMLESVQWLITRGKIDEALTCFQRVAKFNNITLNLQESDEFRTELCRGQQRQNNKKTSSLLGLFRTKRLRRHTLILFFKSMVITLCYDAISRNVEGLGISPFIMFSLSATAIFPACLILLLLQDKIGRKALASLSLLVSGIFTAATGIAIAYQKGAPDPILLVSLAIVGRFGVTIAYNCSVQYATELVPTCVRAQGVAAVHLFGYAFTFFSSYILYLSNIFKPLPSLVLGVLSLAGAVLCLFLPETLNKTLPQTLEDGEEFGKNEKVLDFSCWQIGRTKTESTTTLHAK